MKIKDAFDDYIRYEIQAMGGSVNTAHVYENASKITIAYFGNTDIKRIDLAGVNDFYLSMRQTHSMNTCRHYISNLRAVIRHCRCRGITTMNPDDIKTPRSEKKVARFLDLDEYYRFLAEAERPCRGYSNSNRLRNAIIVKLLFATGLRVSELCALNRDSIKHCQFVVVGKSKEPRPCFITREIEKDLARYMATRCDHSPALFVANQTGTRITPHNVQRIFRGLSQKSGIWGVTPHTLRHSFATRLIEDGVDIRYVAAFLGHQSLQTTQRYTHVRDYKLWQIYQEKVENCR